MSNLNEERLRKFKEMGIPEPMAPIDPGSVQGPVRNLNFAAKLAALKSGQKRQELNTFLEKAEPAPGFVPLEVPAPKHQAINEGRPRDPRKPEPPPLKTERAAGPSFDIYEKALLGEDRSSRAEPMYANEPDPYSPTYKRATPPPPIRGYQAEIEESNPSNFFDSIKAKLAQKNAAVAQQIREGRQPALQEASVHSQMDDDQIRQYITEISSGVCKKLIKQFMSEYLASEPSLIKENDKIKKAEVIKEDIVKIDGKFFKLTPVQLKKK
jgi:hypothetical protein